MPELRKIQLEELEALIVTQEFHSFGLLTVCVLTLSNGFKSVGESAAMSELWYDAEIGMTISRQRALDQLWKLEGYHRMRLCSDAVLHDDVRALVVAARAVSIDANAPATEEEAEGGKQLNGELLHDLELALAQFAARVPT